MAEQIDRRAFLRRAASLALAPIAAVAAVGVPDDQRPTYAEVRGQLQKRYGASPLTRVPGVLRLHDEAGLYL